jgi:hypothetical protein
LARHFATQAGGLDHNASGKRILSKVVRDGSTFGLLSSTAYEVNDHFQLKRIRRALPLGGPGQQRQDVVRSVTTGAFQRNDE